MRLNKAIALATGMSRRAADKAISSQRVTINGHIAQLGQVVTENDQVSFDNRIIDVSKQMSTSWRSIMLHKPVGYVVSRNGQGSPTIYELLPLSMRDLKPVGRLDKDSSGLLLMTNDGMLAQELTHPRYGKVKVYNITIDKPLSTSAIQRIYSGIPLEDGISRFKLSAIGRNGTDWQVELAEGRNRQIRRTFAALGYTVTRLERVSFGQFRLEDLAPGEYRNI